MQNDFIRQVQIMRSETVPEGMKLHVESTHDVMLCGMLQRYTYVTLPIPEEEIVNLVAKGEFWPRIFEEINRDYLRTKQLETLTPAGNA